MSERRRDYKDPRDGSLFTVHELIMWNSDWERTRPELSGHWTETRFGPLMIATRIVFAD